jgi:hypothetical protein
MWRNKKGFSWRNYKFFNGLEEERTFCEEGKMRNDKVISDLERATIFEEMNWRQKSRALWLREGVKCTRFFH